MGKLHTARLSGRILRPKQARTEPFCSRPERTTTRRAVLLLAAVCLAACSDTGPVYPTSDTLDPWVTSPASIDPQSDQPPIVSDQTVRFHLAPGQQRSSLRAGREWGTVQTYLYGFDLRLDPNSLGPVPLTLSRLQRLGTPAADIVSVQLDRRRGLSVFGHSCIAPADLGDWHSVEVRINLADDDTGYIEIFCDRKPILAIQGLRTTRPPVCRRAEGCTAPVSHPARYEWQIGLLAPRRVARAVTIDMRRIFYHRLFVIPNPIKTPIKTH